MAFALKLQMNLMQSISLVFVPIFYSVFISVLGIALNKSHPNYEWTSEMVVVKQSLPVLLSSMIGMVALAIPVLLTWFFNLPIGLTLGGAGLILFVVAIGIYLKISKSTYI